jgi:hypothetical protein
MLPYPLENALFQWEEGYRRFEETRDDPGRHRQAWRVVNAIEDELRRRIGPTFTALELAQLYARGTEWAQEVAAGFLAPELDPQQLADAAFWRYLRGARDFAGGRQVEASSAASSASARSHPNNWR